MPRHPGNLPVEAWDLLEGWTLNLIHQTNPGESLEAASSGELFDSFIPSAHRPLNRDCLGPFPCISLERWTDSLTGRDNYDIFLGDGLLPTLYSH